jgi:NAD(P)-dependent dehydrogenase (short-subunit alcohol dehydrogenase family)
MTEAWSLSGRRAFITGAARGIGRAIALKLAERGSAVVVTDAHPQPFSGERYYRLHRRVSGVEEQVPTAEAIRQLGGKAMDLQLDVADPEAVRRAAETAVDTFGKIDILINNAGIVNNIARIADMPANDWAHELQVNLSGAFHCTQALVPAMAERGWGRVINISSVAARQPGMGQPAYTASKAGLAAFTQSIAQEFGARGVTANAIMPGLMATPLVLSMPADLRESMIARTAVQQLGTPEDIAELAAFLASDAARFITGTAIPCDGGLLGAPLG